MEIESSPKFGLSLIYRENANVPICVSDAAASQVPFDTMIAADWRILATSVSTWYAAHSPTTAACDRDDAVEARFVLLELAARSIEVSDVPDLDKDPVAKARGNDPTVP